MARIVQSLKDDVYAFQQRHRKAPPHVHHCPECYEDSACGMDCTIVDETDKGLPMGGHAVCELCKGKRS